MLSCPRDFFLMFQTFPECSSSTMFVIQKHSGSVRLKGRNVTTPLDLSEKHDLSHLTVSSPCDVLLVQKSLNLLKSFCPCCYLTWLSKPFSHEINELKNTAETHACVKKCMHKHHAIIYELLTAAVTWYMLLQTSLHHFIIHLVYKQANQSPDRGNQVFTLLLWLASC